MINKDEIGSNIKELLKGHADSRTEIEITVKNSNEADVFLDGKLFNTYLIDEKRFKNNIPKPMKRHDAFSVSAVISRDDLRDSYKMYEGAELQLPATVNEVKDAMLRARIKGKEQPYSVMECIMYGKDIIPRFVNETVDFDKLNYLAKVMNGFSSHEHELFKGLMQTIPDDEFTIKALINGAYNLEGCSVIDDLKDDEQLGRIYTDNGWIEWLVDVDERVRKYMDYTALGRDIRIKDGGIYTDDGYFVKSKDKHKEIYDGITYPETFADDEYIFKLLISPKPDSDGADDVEHWLTLPASKEQKTEFLRQLGTESYDDCILIAVQSMEEYIPMCVEDISQLGQLNALAHHMRDMERTGELAKFKAILSVRSIETLNDVILIANELDRFELSQNPTTVIEYAREQFIREYSDKIPKNLIEHFNFATYSEELNHDNRLRPTKYGVLKIPMTDETQVALDI